MKVNSSDDNIIQLFHIIRKSLSYTFKLNYEFTYEELKNEIKKKKIKEEEKRRILKFVTELEDFEYNPSKDKKKLSNKIRRISNEFKSIIKVIYENKQDITKGKIKAESFNNKFMKRFMKRISLNPFHFIKRNKRKRNKKTVKGKTVEKIYSILLKANESLDSGNYERVKYLYNEIKEVYDKLNEEDKKKVYADVMVLYKRLMRKQAEK
ncbi:MAG: hypothetical protein GWP09_00650 [Nitrospiraceae bacterium]|nr:hypothetical protein [Nitrospiraceae bacterium]